VMTDLIGVWEWTWFFGASVLEQIAIRFIVRYATI